MALSSLRRYLRPALVHLIAVVWFGCVLANGAGFTLGCAFHRLQVWLAAQTSAVLAPDPQQEATISGWEAEVAAGWWIRARYG